MVPLFTNLLKSTLTPSLSYSLSQFFTEVFGFDSTNTSVLVQGLSSLISLHLPSSFPLSPYLDVFCEWLIQARHPEEEQADAHRLRSLQKSFSQQRVASRHVSSALEEIRSLFDEVTAQYSSLLVGGAAGL